MKKIYFILFGLISFVSNAQILADDFNYTDNALLSANGWTAFSGANTQSVDVGASNGLTYTDYSGTSGFTGAVVGNAARLDNNGEDVQRTFTPVTSGTIYYTFLVNITDGTTGYFAGLTSTGTTFNNRIFVRPSTNAGKINFGLTNTATATYGTVDYDINTTYLIIVKYELGSGASSIWVKSSGIPASEATAGTADVTVTGSGASSIGGFFLRQYSATQNITVDGLRIFTTWFNTTPCSLSLGNETTTCTAVTLNIDTYSVSIPFTGGGTGTYNLSATSGTISGDNPSSVAAGNIIISGINEGTNVTLNVSGTCSIIKNISSPQCKPVNTLPYYEAFNYATGASLVAQQRWTNVNTGDEIIMGTGLSYTGLTTAGNAATFDGAGIEAFTPFTSTNSGTVYYSLLINASTLAGATDVNGGYLAGFGESTTSYGGTLWTKRIDDTTYNIGVEVRTAAGATTSFDTTTLNAGTTYFIVVAYTFGADASDDTVKLWINPALTATEPTANVTDSHAATDLSSVGWFFLRQDSTTETPFVAIDELRIGTTWTDVVPQTAGLNENSISGLSIYPNPSNGLVNITTSLNAELQVTIFDMLGKEVANTKVSNNSLNVSNLTSGIYIVKITEEGKTATRKLIIQ